MSGSLTSPRLHAHLRPFFVVQSLAVGRGRCCFRGYFGKGEVGNSMNWRKKIAKEKQDRRRAAFPLLILSLLPCHLTCKVWLFREGVGGHKGTSLLPPTVLPVPMGERQPHPPLSTSPPPLPCSPEPAAALPPCLADVLLAPLSTERRVWGALCHGNALALAGRD